MKGEHTDEMQFKNGTGGMYKPRRQVRGEGVAEMSTLLNNGY